jgi:hypothetical protein
MTPSSGNSSLREDHDAFALMIFYFSAGMAVFGSRKAERMQHCRGGLKSAAARACYFVSKF